MTLTHLTIKISSPADPQRVVKVSFLIDSGAIYSVVPVEILKKLKIRPEEER